MAHFRISYTVTRLSELVERINKEMDRLQIKPIDLARMAEVPPPSVYRLANGQRGVEPETLKAIGRVLGIQPMELAYYIGLVDEMPRTKEIQSAIFVAEWEKASAERRRDLLELLKALNKIDARGDKRG